MQRHRRIRWGLLASVLAFLFWPALLLHFGFGGGKWVFAFPVLLDAAILAAVVTLYHHRSK